MLLGGFGQSGAEDGGSQNGVFRWKDGLCAKLGCRTHAFPSLSRFLKNDAAHGSTSSP
jgi:hypothetical protein